MHLDSGPPDVARAGSNMPERPSHIEPALDGTKDGGTATVSVVIPTRDRPDLIRRSVATALAQQGVVIEVVVVDDGSAFPAIDALAPDPRVRVLRNEVSQGVARARNRGIEASTAEWIAFLDDDDLWAPCKIALQLAATVASGGTWSHTGTLLLDEQLSVAARWPLQHTESSFDDLRIANWVSTPSTVMASKAELKAVGGFDPVLSIMADWDLWLRLSLRSPGQVIGEPLAGYVVHSRSMHRQDSRALLREMREVQRRHRAAGGIRSPYTWRWIARIHWDTGKRARAVPLGVFATYLLLTNPRSLGRTGAGLLRRVRAAFRTKAPTDQDPDWVAVWAGPSAT